MVNLLQLALPHAQRRTPSRTHGHTDTRTEISSPQRRRGVPFIDAKALDVVSHQKREDTRRPCRRRGERSQSAPAAGRTWAQGRVRCCLWPDPSPSRHTPHQTQAGSPTHQASSSRKGTQWGCGRAASPPGAGQVPRGGHEWTRTAWTSRLDAHRHMFVRKNCRKLHQRKRQRLRSPILRLH